MQPVIDRRNDPQALVAYCATALWLIGDSALRTEIEALLRQAVQRTPTLRSALNARTVGSPIPDVPNDDRARAALLYALWEFADGELRADVQALIGRYLGRHPERKASFSEVIATHEAHRRAMPHGAPPSLLVAGAPQPGERLRYMVYMIP